MLKKPLLHQSLILPRQTSRRFFATVVAHFTEVHLNEWEQQMQE